MPDFIYARSTFYPIVQESRTEQAGISRFMRLPLTFILPGMKFLTAGILLAASIAPMRAQIVTLHGTVVTSITDRAGPYSLHYTLMPGVSAGDSVTQTFTMTHFIGLTSSFPGGGIYAYSADTTLQVGNLGTLISNSPGDFWVQDAVGAWGIDTYSFPLGPSVGSTDVELWSTDSSVLENHFLTPVSDGSKFDWLYLGFHYTLDSQLDLAWEIDSVDVTNFSAVPEASTFGYFAAAGLIGLTLYRRSKRA